MRTPQQPMPLSFSLAACITGCFFSASISAQVGLDGRPFGPPLAPKPAPAPFPPPMAPAIAPRPSDPPPTKEQWELWCRRPAPSATAVDAAEPEIVGRFVDRDTGQGLAGVVVFGSYAPAVDAMINGTPSSWTRDCMLHGFEAVSDANGNFIVPAWKGRHLLTLPARWNVSIVFYKGGYETTGLGLKNSISNWGENAKTSRRGSSRIDLTAQPIRLTQIRPYQSTNGQVESRHWQSHARASFGLGLSQPCDWERSPQILLALHRERKNLIRLALGAQNLDRDGYGRVGTAPPNDGPDYSQRSEVDMLIAEHARARAAWKCGDPNKIFPAGERNAPAAK
jgi:hypothetical protein